MSFNRLKLNPSKTELIWLHSSRRNPGFIQNDIERFGNFIAPVRVVRNLGVILDESLTMLDHISSVCQRCYYQLRQIRNVRNSGSHYLMLPNFFWFLHRCIVGWTIIIVFFAHCLSLACSCVSLCWIRHSRLIRGLGQFDHITYVLIDLHWLPYPQHISYKNLFAYVQVLDRFGPCLSFWFMCWLFCCSESIWFEIRSSRWSFCAGTQTRVGFFCCGGSEMLE